MREITLMVLLVVTGLTSYTQVQPTFNQCPGGTDACGPDEKINERTQLTGLALQQAPFPYILHQEIKRFSTNYSTGSFIAPDMILTAHHNVMSPAFIRRLNFCNKAVDPDKWVRLRRQDVDIILFGAVNAPTDIAIIKIKNPAKIKSLYQGHFGVSALSAVSDTAKAHLTGFPCDLPDILTDKHTAKKELKINSTLIGYYVYTCTGDSGAPLWAIVDGKPVIMGIHHGGGEGYFPKDWNCSAAITKEVIDWIDRQR